MSKNNTTEPDNKITDNWTNYKIYVVECIKSLTETTETLEKKLVDLQLEHISQIFKLKEEMHTQMKNLADTVLKLQIRVGMICAGIAILITIAANIFTHILVSFIDK